ncbi:phage tail protein [Rhodanobacter sp. C03]|uniref:phage tail protein n=1 Tax=Rhodanobacter sp. C03 TaxID=1945858 RepID=UPI0009849E3C|nr:phage tail protein [Rhodanobacter sp. C03]OOG53329.1 hypothetical protein B0E48_16175 [Rhodanobacter sp. C03]
MKKPASLRAALVAALPDLARDPERLLVFIDAGSLQSTYAPGLSFETTYTLNLIVTDFAGDPLVVWLAILIWLRVNQLELLDNVDKRQTGVQFEADIIDHDKVDLSIKLQLSERVIVRDLGNGKLDITIADEPQPEAHLVAAHWSIYLRDQLLTEWDVPPA